MSEETQIPSGSAGGGEEGAPLYERIRHNPVAARVPEDVGGGVLATGSMVMMTNGVFVVDFLATMVAPHRVAARVIVLPATFARLVGALKESYAQYEQRFAPAGSATPEANADPTDSAAPAPEGPAETNPSPQPVGAPATEPTSSEGAESMPPAAPGPPAQSMQVSDRYDQLKLPDEMLGGSFASTVMIRYTSDEFCLDFIANFYPKSVLTNRVYLASGRVAAFIKTFSGSLQKFQEQHRGPGPAGGRA